ncbi:cyclic nucleotide-binding domain-containing protein [Roseovarius salis]|uniref:Crp/Fnr family transcriptional regulator n=1 Tax=Roseovarius salis TaxID=3376063 RepID=UPI0037CA0B02
MSGWVAETEGLPPLDPRATQRLNGLAPIQAPAGTTLFHPGDTVKGFVIMLSGRVEVFLAGPNGREILLYAVEPGQTCIQSTLGLMGGEDYSGEAIVRRDSRMVLVPRDTFLALMSESDAFRGFVFHAFATRLQSMMHLLERVAFLRVEARLAQCLLDRSENGTLSATHAEIASMIGSAREVVSRRLDALERRGILRVGRGRVQVLDAAALSELAASD